MQCRCCIVYVSVLCNLLWKVVNHVRFFSELQTLKFLLSRYEKLPLVILTLPRNLKKDSTTKVLDRDVGSTILNSF